MGVFHDVEDALSVLSSAEAVAEICQSVFVQGARQQQSQQDGEQNGDRIGEQHAAEIEGRSHGAAREPAHQWPELHDSLITVFGRLVDAPKGKSREKQQCSPGVLPPLRSI